MKQVLSIISGVLLAGLVFWLFSTWWYHKPSDNNQYIANAVYDSMKFEIKCLSADKAALSDSIFGIRVDKGYTEIQLNQSKAELDRLIAAYKHVKIKHDTARILINADSIISEVEGNYIPKSIAIQGLSCIIDSMQQVQIKIGDSIEYKSNALINSLTDDLLTERINNAILTEKARRRKKIPIFAAIGGFVTGILTIILIQ